MKQLTQKLKDGAMSILEVPTPVLSAGMVLVRNHYSLISAGTEGSTVSAARKSLIGKAKERPQQVKQVLDILKQQGPVQAYRTVMKKLDAYSPLGYSSAGVVLEMAPDVKGFSVGDLVACGGAGYASHAEIVAVPQNLCVKLPAGADLRKAVYNTLGAIALQGVRQADLRIGEIGAVIGLGLIGQLTALILKAGGLRVVGLDIDARMVEIAREHCVDIAFIREETGIAEKIDEFTQGVGVDAVIITAATESLDPINFAGRIARKKGRVVVVGDVPTGFDREPYYYRKELELRMSCSYGPGRYDLNYEEKGIDYPVGYVRWTENRNMQAFQELVHSGKIDIGYLTTHIFKLDDAPQAYDMIMDKKEPFIGILIEYDIEKSFVKERIQIHPSHITKHPSPVSIAFIGAGSYAMGNLLPNIPREKDIVLKGVMTSSGTSSRTVADKYGFEFCTSDENDILNNAEINTVFIVTRHNTHADYVIKALKAGKNVYVEKPLCLNERQLNEISEVYTSLLTSHSSQPFLMLGFNRRFSPLTEMLKEKIGEGPMSMIYRINAGQIPAGSWIQDKAIGGGRIIGEVCHFVDYLTFLNGSLPESVFASALPDPQGLEDTITINIKFLNGSIGTISYFSNGSKSLSKEYIEVYRAGTAALLKDFKNLEIYGAKVSKKSLISQDKGQKRMLSVFLDAVRQGKPSPINFEEIYTATLTTFKIIESIKTRQSIAIL
ncbi:MAG: Gfo/Idh/MocA family oxidoreductase [Nitrospirae bacterium]|nr:Gfo/Idh/MocA family oxidoreductase [Nitrospirota bacterium]